MSSKNARIIPIPTAIQPTPMMILTGSLELIELTPAIKKRKINEITNKMAKISGYLKKIINPPINSMKYIKSKVFS
jgi:hypothetical protein